MRVKAIKWLVVGGIGLLVVGGGYRATSNWIAKCTRLSANWGQSCGNVFVKLGPWLGGVDARLPVMARELAWLLPYQAYLTGFPEKINYLVLLQNDTEMRANGGFFGSYAVVNVDQGLIDWRFQDIYVPDGAIEGYVEPPKPIQDAFGKGSFYLRDADWDPNFVQTAKTIRWFMVKGGEIEPEMLVTVNLTTIKKILTVVGPITIPDYDVVLDADNVFQLLQAKVESDFFPGSTQKKDLLASAGQALWLKIQQLNWRQQLAIGAIIREELNEQNMLLHATRTDLQEVWQAKNWAGELTYPTCQDPAGCDLDVTLAVEANLGANKANGYIERRSVHTITELPTSWLHQIKVYWVNHATEENPRLPEFFGGNYINYMRYYLPKNSREVVVRADPVVTTVDQTEKEEWLEIGFFQTTKAASTSTLELTYELPKSTGNYELHLLKQHGMQSAPQEIKLGATKVQTELRNDYVFSQR